MHQHKYNYSIVGTYPVEVFFTGSMFARICYKPVGHLAKMRWFEHSSQCWHVGYGGKNVV